MEAKAIARYIRITPRKVRQVIDLIRGKSVGEALTLLRFTPKGASEVIAKVVKSAAANAEHNYSMNLDALVVAEAMVDPGPTLKRIMPRPHGRANRMLKRTSHITIVLKEKEGKR